MGKTRENKEMKPRKAGSFPSPSSSSSSSSSSDFEFTVSLSPSSRKSSYLCPADELFYKGQLLPLHPSPRISMVRTLFLASSSTSSSSSSTCTSTTASRDSNGSNSSSLPSSECNSSRPSSATEEEEEITKAINSASTNCKQRNNYFSSFANRLSSKFLSRGGSKKDTTTTFGLDLDCQIPALLPPPTSEKRTSSFAKQVLKKYVKKVKPFYDKLSSKNQNQNIQSPNKKKTFSFPVRKEKDVMGSIKKLDEGENPRDSAGINEIYPHSQSFSGNLRFPRRKRCAGSCPSSMRSSPTHSGLLSIGNAGGFPLDHLTLASSSTSSSSSSMDELHSAIQGAIAHCKSTMIQSNQEKALDLSSPATSVN